jgi:hypothetical protein
MMRSRFPVARVSALAALVVGAFLVTQRTGGVHWRSLRPGVEFATLRGEPYCRYGSAAVAALRLDPARVRLRVLHFSGDDRIEADDFVVAQRDISLR